MAGRLFEQNLAANRIGLRISMADARCRAPQVCYRLLPSGILPKQVTDEHDIRRLTNGRSQALVRARFGIGEDHVNRHRLRTRRRDQLEPFSQRFANSNVAAVVVVGLLVDSEQSRLWPPIGRPVDTEEPIVDVFVDLTAKSGGNSPARQHTALQRAAPRTRRFAGANGASYLAIAFSISPASRGSAPLNTFVPFSVTSTTSSMRIPRFSSGI